MAGRPEGGWARALGTRLPTYAWDSYQLQGRGKEGRRTTVLGKLNHQPASPDGREEGGEPSESRVAGAQAEGFGLGEEAAGPAALPVLKH